MDEWITKLVYTYNGILCKLQKEGPAQIDLEDNIPSEVIQSQKDKHYMI